MDRDTMVQKVRESLGDAAAEFDGATIQAALNRAHRWIIPDALAKGVLGTVSFPTVAGTDLYALDEGDVRSLLPRAGAWIDDTPLDVSGNWDEFWSWFKFSDLTQRKPSAALVLDRQVWLRPVPDAAYTIRFFGDQYPTALGAPGVTYEPRALADVYGAALEIARDAGYDLMLDALTRMLQGQLDVIRSAQRAQGSVPLGAYEDL